MKEYIEREKAIEALCRCCLANGNCGHTCKEITALQSIPAADVRPVVHGTWISVMAHYTNGRVEQAWGDAYSPLFKCSECGFELISYDNINFCPKCGAWMEES